MQIMNEVQLTARIPQALDSNAYEALNLTGAQLLTSKTLVTQMAYWGSCELRLLHTSILLVHGDF